MMCENLKIAEMQPKMLDECVDLYINTFSKEPWNETDNSRNQVMSFYENHLKNNYFLGYVGILNGKIVALSVGMKKPWLKGVEYYIDEFCVDYSHQGKGIGSDFINKIEQDIKKNGLNGIILNTEKDFPSEKFYLKNGFKKLGNLIVLGK